MQNMSRHKLRGETKLKGRQLVNLGWVVMWMELDKCCSIFHQYVFKVTSESGMFKSSFPHSLCYNNFP